MRVHAGQLRELVVRPTLKALGLHSQAAEDLVMGTAAQESRLQYIKQLSDGPALGLWQCEPNTHRDIWRNWLRYRTDVTERLCDWCGVDEEPPAETLMWNLRYGSAICRIHYRRVNEPLPEAGDVEAYAEAWKAHYNTILGAGTAEEFVEHWALVA